jgi:hypothetical protein
MSTHLLSGISLLIQNFRSRREEERRRVQALGRPRDAQCAALEVTGHGGSIDSHHGFSAGSAALAAGTATRPRRTTRSSFRPTMRPLHAHGDTVPDDMRRKLARRAPLDRAAGQAIPPTPEKPDGRASQDRSSDPGEDPLGMAGPFADP